MPIDCFLKDILELGIGFGFDIKLKKKINFLNYFELKSVEIS